MTSDEFKAWRKAMGFTIKDTTEALGISKSSVELYERGRRHEDGRPVVIPMTVALACQYLRMIRQLENGEFSIHGKNERGEIVDLSQQNIESMRRMIDELKA